MRITVFGAAGNVGSRVVAEALSRGHEVTAVVRNPARFPQLPAGAEARVGDASNPEDVARLSAGQDVVIGATRPAPARANSSKPRKGCSPASPTPVCGSWSSAARAA
ncbi:putative NADH-flavin reductase [Streptomyces netropsis]|nr:putative NADH-flavin reductase [Streptomyces netropsis]